MSIPKDGFYTARVFLDTGGAVRLFVRVLSGVPYSDHAMKRPLLSEACSQFEPASTLEFCQAWSDEAAMELDALRTANKALVERVAELQSWKDQQMQVESEWRPNELATLLGGRLGESQRVVIQREVPKLVEQLAAHKAVVEDPVALWANWLRGTVQLPAGIGDVRQLEERVKRLEEAGDALSTAWLTDRDIEDIRDDWNKAKEAKP